MIFNSVDVIIKINVILVIFLVLTLLYLYTLNLYTKIRNDTKKKMYMKWHKEIKRAVVTDSEFVKTGLFNRKWFNQLIISYLLSFKGDIKEKLDNIYISTGVFKYACKQVDSLNYSKRIDALLSILYSGLKPDNKTKEKLALQISKTPDVTTILIYRILVRHWYDEYALVIIAYVAQSDFFSENAKIEIAMEMKEFLSNNFQFVYKELQHSKESIEFLCIVAGKLEIDSGILILMHYFERGEGELFIKSMKALGDLKYLAAKDLIKETFLSHETPIVQTLAFRSFLKMTDELDIPFIEKQLFHDNWFVRYAAAKSILRYGKNGIAIIKKYPNHDCTSLVASESGLELEKETYYVDI